MSRTLTGRRRLRRAAALGLAACSLAAPAAQATHVHGVPHVPAAARDVVATDPRHAALLERRHEAKPAVTDARHATLLGRARRPTAAPSTSADVDWVDAGIGAAIGFAVAGMLGGALLIGRRRGVPAPV